MRFEFEVKRPGEHELEGWALLLPRQCDSWEIGAGTAEEVLGAAREFRAGLDEAIRGLERAGGDADERARYAAARAGAARSLREVEAEAAELGLGSLAGLAGWQAQQFEGWTPFTALPKSAFRLPWRPPEIPAGCYEASFGWVHVRPGCRCAR